MARLGLTENPGKNLALVYRFSTPGGFPGERFLAQQIVDGYLSACAIKGQLDVARWLAAWLSGGDA